MFLQFTYNGVPILPADVDMFEDTGVRARLANAGTLVADSSPTFIVIQRTATGFQGYSFYV